MEFKPHEYQKVATQKIINNKASGLFLQCGMGKTVSTLTAIQELIYNSFDVARVLIIAPLRVAESVWGDEIDKWDHLRNLKMSKVLGSAAARRKALKVDADVYIINRENVEWLVEELKFSWKFDMVVVDELSSFKSSKARRFRALKKMIPAIDRIVGLTGTPAPNGLLDLWPQMYLLDIGERLGKTKKAYLERYFDCRSNKVMAGGKLITYPTYSLKERAEKAIYKKIGDICISMKANDYLNMPERIDNVIDIKLPDAAKARYKELEKERILEFIGSDVPVTAKSAVSLSGKLLQMANGAVYDEDRGVRHVHDEKLNALGDIVEAANGNPVIVLYNYRHDLHRIKERFKQAKQLESNEDIENWNAGNISVMLGHPASCGHGLNLQYGGSLIVWFGLTWSLELYQQANARLDRQGQKNTVIIHHLVAKGTIDEVVIKVLKGKAQGQDALLEAVKAKIKEYRG